MKGQSKRASLTEACINVGVGYGIACSAQIIIFPWFGIHIPVSDHMLIGGFFTVVSVGRSYLLRRIFNWIHVRGSRDASK